MDHDTAPQTAALWPPPEPETRALPALRPDGTPDPYSMPRPWADPALAVDVSGNYPPAQVPRWRAEIAAELGPPPDVQVLKTLTWLVGHDEVWQDRGLTVHAAAYLDATSPYWRSCAADPADSPEAHVRAVARHAGANRLRSLRQWHDMRDVVDAAAGILRREPAAEPPGGSGTDAS